MTEQDHDDATDPLAATEFEVRWFDRVRGWLDGTDAGVAPEELTGAVTAWCCTSATDDVFDALLPMLDEAAPGQTQAALAIGLAELAGAVREQLDQGQFDIDGVLPGDDYGIRDRTEALARWCAGFLFALPLSGGSLEGEEDGQLHEILQDFSEITRLSIPQVVDGETEGDLMQVCEYVRVGVLHCYGDLWHIRQQVEGKS